MENICSEDQQQISVACCACKFPLPPLCQEHAYQHSRDSSCFHFPLPLSVYQVIRTKEDYLHWKPWLFQLSSSYELLREKLQLLTHGEELIEAAYQEFLRLASETKTRLKQKFSEKKELVHTEIEAAIAETRKHALETYEPELPLAQLLWYNQPYQVVQTPLFTFQIGLYPEHVLSTFSVCLDFEPILDHLNDGKCATPIPDSTEEQIAFLEESHQPFCQLLEDTKCRFHALQEEYRTLHSHSVVLQTENESLKKQHLVHTNKLYHYQKGINDLREKHAQLHSTLQERNLRVEELLQQLQTLQKKCGEKAKRCALLEQEKATLERKGKRRKNLLRKSVSKLKQSRKKKAALKTKFKRRGIN